MVREYYAYKGKRKKEKKDDRNYLKLTDFERKKKKIRIFATRVIYRRKTRILEYLIKKGSGTRVQLTATLFIITRIYCNKKKTKKQNYSL